MNAQKQRENLLHLIAKTCSTERSTLNTKAELLRINTFTKTYILEKLKS